MPLLQSTASYQAGCESPCSNPVENNVCGTGVVAGIAGAVAVGGTGVAVLVGGWGVGELVVVAVGSKGTLVGVGVLVGVLVGATSAEILGGES